MNKQQTIIWKKLEARWEKGFDDIMLLVFGKTYPKEREDRFTFLTQIEAKLGPDYDRVATNFIQDAHEDFVSAAINNLEKPYARLNG